MFLAVNGIRNTNKVSGFIMAPSKYACVGMVLHHQYTVNKDESSLKETSRLDQCKRRNEHTLV